MRLTSTGNGHRAKFGSRKSVANAGGRITQPPHLQHRLHTSLQSLFAPPLILMLDDSFRAQCSRACLREVMGVSWQGGGSDQFRAHEIRKALLFNQDDTLDGLVKV